MIVDSAIARQEYDQYLADKLAAQADRQAPAGTRGNVAISRRKGHAECTTYRARTEQADPGAPGRLFSRGDIPWMTLLPVPLRRR
jgi:hypothetical protein